MTLAELEKKAKDLSAEERARFALTLIESLESTEDDAVEEAWRLEAERRWSEIERGEARLVPGDEVFEKVQRRLQ